MQDKVEDLLDALFDMRCVHGFNMKIHLDCGVLECTLSVEGDYFGYALYRNDARGNRCAGTLRKIKELGMRNTLSTAKEMILDVVKEHGHT